VKTILQAIFGTVVSFSVLTWCIDRKGPLFVTMFKPVGIAIAAFMSVAFLGETLHIGR
jgi:drug/metabolite transporter (DMT)-like permease